MTIEELKTEINSQCEKNEIQTEDQLDELHILYSKVFLTKCGEIPMFYLNCKGQITIHERT